MKKITKLLMLSVLLFISACTASTDKENDSNKITIWAWDESFNIRAVQETMEFYEGDYEDLFYKLIHFLVQSIRQFLLQEVHKV